MVRGNRALLVGFVLGSITVLGVWAVVGVRGGMANGVLVEIDAQPLTCDGASVEIQPEPDEAGGLSDDFRVAMATLEPGMDCWFRFFVRNTTGRAVTIESITLPAAFGPASGSGARATSLNPISGTGDGQPSAEQGGATWFPDRLLEPDGQIVFEIRFEFQPGGCTSPGGSVGIGGPEVVVGSWGMSVSARSVAPLGFIGTEHSDCDG